MNRRELLKLFGVGATVVPIIDGAPAAAAARIVAPPKVEPVQFQPALAMEDFLGAGTAVLYFKGERGNTVRWECRGVSAAFDFVDLTTVDSPTRVSMRIPAARMTFELSGDPVLVQL